MKTHSEFPYDASVVLVRSIYERNVGATSRAMANMGFRRLILIDPQCDITFEAQQAAATGQEALQNRKVYSSWKEFFHHEPEGFRIALTARDGRGRAVKELAETLQTLRTEALQSEVAENSSAKESPGTQLYLIFGPEDWGLSAADLEYTHFACSIPTFGENPSLNLAQAVLLALFVVRNTYGGTRTTLEGAQTQKKAQQDQISFFETTLKEWLQEMGFNFDHHKKINAYSVLRRAWLRNLPTQKELRMMEIVVQQSLRKLKEYNKMRRENQLASPDSN